MISGHSCISARQQSIMATDTWLLYKCLESCSMLSASKPLPNGGPFYLYFQAFSERLKFFIAYSTGLLPLQSENLQWCVSHILHKESNSVRSVSNKTMSYVCCMRQTRGIGYKWNTRHCAASLLKLSLVPRPRVRGKSGLVSTVCACANDSGNFPWMSPVTDKLQVVVLRRNNQARYTACSVAAVFTQRWLHYLSSLFYWDAIKALVRNFYWRRKEAGLR